MYATALKSRERRPVPAIPVEPLVNNSVGNNVYGFEEEFLDYDFPPPPPDWSHNLQDEKVYDDIKREKPSNSSTKTESTNRDDTTYSLQNAGAWGHTDFYDTAMWTPGILHHHGGPQTNHPYNVLHTEGGSDSVMRRRLQKDAPLSISHTTRIEENQTKVILELKSKPDAYSVPRVPLRLICLFDTSGSMVQKFGPPVNGLRETKITKMRNVARMITKTLEETDYFGILSFGEETETLWPLSKNTEPAKKEILSQLKHLGKNGLSLKTNLSQAIFSALDMYRKDSRERRVRCFETRDVIIVLTDGDINEGTTNAQKLVREVRQAIRELENEMGQYNRNPSMTICTVVTGNNVSDAVYLLSKTCGSDAYYYIDKTSGAVEIGALMPVMLRKTSVANSISVQVKAVDPAELIPKECSHEYMAHRPHHNDDQLNYFIHDIGTAASKHLVIVLDKESVFAETEPTAEILQVKIEYRDSMMQKHMIHYNILRREFSPTLGIPASLVAVNIHDIRRILQLALRDAADFLKQGQPEWAVSALLQNAEDVEMEAGRFSESLNTPSEGQKLTDFVMCVTSNLTNLIEMIQDTQCNEGEAWSAIKATSSAISREAPSANKLLAQERQFQSRCSLADDFPELKQSIKSQYSQRGVMSAMFYDFDVTLEDLGNTLSRDNKPLSYAPDYNSPC